MLRNLKNHVTIFKERKYNGGHHDFIGNYRRRAVDYEMPLG